MAPACPDRLPSGACCSARTRLQLLLLALTERHPVTLDRRTPLPAPRTPMARSAPLARAALPRQAAPRPPPAPNRPALPRRYGRGLRRDRGACVRCQAPTGRSRCTIADRGPQAGLAGRTRTPGEPAAALRAPPARRKPPGGRARRRAAAAAGSDPVRVPVRWHRGTSCSATTAPSPRRAVTAEVHPGLALDDALAAADRPRTLTGCGRPGRSRAARAVRAAVHSDNVWARLDGSPREPRALGSILRAWSRAGLIRPTRRWR